MKINFKKGGDICDGFARFKNGLGFHFLSTSANNAKEYSMTYILGSKGGLEVTDTDMAGGKFARPEGVPRPMFGEEPNLRYFGNWNGRDVSMDLRCDENGNLEELTNPEILLYNDDQAMSPLLFLWEQQIGSQLVKFDVDF